MSRSEYSANLELSRSIVNVRIPRDYAKKKPLPRFRKLRGFLFRWFNI